VVKLKWVALEEGRRRTLVANHEGNILLER
jgi:hypothetical protein